MASADSLWFDVTTTDRGSSATVALKVCRNCGKTKVTSDPCGFDHLAALMEFRAAASNSSASSAGNLSTGSSGEQAS